MSGGESSRQKVLWHNDLDGVTDIWPCKSSDNRLPFWQPRSLAVRFLPFLVPRHNTVTYCYIMFYVVYSTAVAWRHANCFFHPSKSTRTLWKCLKRQTSRSKLGRLQLTTIISATETRPLKRSPRWLKAKKSSVLTPARRNRARL